MGESRPPGWRRRTSSLETKTRKLGKGRMKTYLEEMRQLSNTAKTKEKGKELEK